MSATQSSHHKGLSSARRRAFDLLVEKSRQNIAGLVAQPTTWSWASDGDFSTWPETFQEIGNWTTSFITGTALIAWKETGDEHFLRETLRLDPHYRAKIERHSEDTMHDLGFLYSLYSVTLYQLTGDKSQRDLALKAAEVLSARFVPGGNYINAWGRMNGEVTDFSNMAIIDCMMNLPLLFWASDETGDPRFHEIAVRHADTTLENFIRGNDSVYHAYRFDHETGAPDRGENYCGYGVETHWARGNAWAIYGFAIAYRYTGDERYLDASLRVTRKFISLLDEEIVPVWDFRLPDDVPAIRDSSAAAIAVCGIQELEAAGKADAGLSAAKNAMLDKLCSEKYLDADPSCRGTLRHGQVGMAVAAYTSWGDYYLMESLARESGNEITWW